MFSEASASTGGPQGAGGGGGGRFMGMFKKGGGGADGGPKTPAPTVRAPSFDDTPFRKFSYVAPEFADDDE